MIIKYQSVFEYNIMQWNTGKKFMIKQIYFFERRKYQFAQTPKIFDKRSFALVKNI